jgi:hypothetical protein
MEQYRMRRNRVVLAVAIGLLGLMATSQYGLAEDGTVHPGITVYFSTAAPAGPS